MRVHSGHHIRITSGYLLPLICMHSRFNRSAVHPSFIRHSSAIHSPFIRHSSAIHLSLSNYYRFLFLNFQYVQLHFHFTFIPNYQHSQITFTSPFIHTFRRNS